MLKAAFRLARLHLSRMVKADVRKDYYADLGLGPDADTDEIKKQFRKLGN